MTTNILNIIIHHIKYLVKNNKSSIRKKSKYIALPVEICYNYIAV